MALTTALSVGATLVGARSSKKAAEKQAGAIQHGADASIAEQRRQFDLTSAQQQPFIQAGTRAIGQLEKIYGIAPDPAAPAPAAQPRPQQPVGMADPRRRIRRGFR